MFKRTWRRRFFHHHAILCKYFHLQYNEFIIYNAPKAVPQTPSHGELLWKHAVNCQENTSRRSVFPTKLYLNHTLIWARHRKFAAHPQNTPKTEHLCSEGLSLKHLQYPYRKYCKLTPYVTKVSSSFQTRSNLLTQIV